MKIKVVVHEAEEGGYWECRYGKHEKRGTRTRNPHVEDGHAPPRPHQPRDRAAAELHTPSYLTRLFSGQIELRFEHIYDITRSMGMTVDEFFRFSYPERGEKPSEAAVKLEAMLEEMRPTPPPPENPRAWRQEEFEKTVVSALEKVVAREQEEARRKLVEDAGQIKELLERWERTEKELRAMIRALEREERRDRREEEGAASGRPRPAGRKAAKKTPA